MGDQPATRTGTTTTGTTTSYGRRTAPASHATSRSGGGNIGGIGIGGVITMLAGLLAFFWGLSAVIKQSFFTSLPNYAYRWNINSWGWLLFALGIALFAAGATYLLGIKLGKWAAVGLAVLTAIAAFLFLPYSPVFGVVVVALCALAIWGCLRDDHVGAGAGGSGAEYGYGDEYGYRDEYSERSMGAGSMGTGEPMERQGSMGTESATGTRGGQQMGSRDTRM